MKVAVFRDELAHTNTSNSPSAPLAGGGAMAVGSFPPPPPGRRYVLQPVPGGGVQVVLVTDTTAQTADARPRPPTPAELNEKYRRFYGQPPAQGATR